MVKASRNRDRGKDFEKYIAKAMGGVRMGILGGEDVMHDKYSIECKSRVKFIGDKFMTQCENNNKRGKIPIVVIHTANMKYEDALVMIKLKDFIHNE